MKTVRVKSVRKVKRPDLVCDVGVEDNHNLFVADKPTDTPVLAHNCWAIISRDQGVADLFQTGADLRKRFRLVPDPWIARRIVDEGDVHRLNASYFFGIPITMREKIKEVRGSVKAVIFGLIYQQGDKGLAKGSGQTVEKIVELKERFLKRFPNGLKWFDKIKNFAWKNLYVESPLGRRRHLWGLMLPQSFPEYSYATSSQERRAVNSPVQGFGSDQMMIGIRNINRMMFEHYQKTGHYPDMELSVSVHDSVTVEVAYEDMWTAIDLIERGLTSEVVSEIQRVYDYEFNSLPEIDFEIGANEKHVDGWDFSYEHAGKLVRRTLEEQRDEHGYDVDIEKVYNSIMTDYDNMPLWMQKQVWANKIDIIPRGAKDPRSVAEKKLSRKYLDVLPKNTKKMENILAKEAAQKQGDEKVAVSTSKGTRRKLAEGIRKIRALRKYRQQMEDKAQAA